MTTTEARPPDDESILSRRYIIDLAYTTPPLDTRRRRQPPSFIASSSFVRTDRRRYTTRHSITVTHTTPDQHRLYHQSAPLLTPLSTNRFSPKGKAIGPVRPSDVRPFVSTLSLEPTDLRTWILLRVWVISLPRLGLKVKVIGQDQGLRLGLGFSADSRPE